MSARTRFRIRWGDLLATLATSILCAAYGVTLLTQILERIS